MIVRTRIPFPYLISELKTPLIYVSIISIVSGILSIYFHSFLADIPINIATTLGVAISILLSYMINQSYERWWEARKIWGEIVNDSRTLVLQLQMYLEEDNPIIKEISYRHIAWNYCMGQHLRKTSSLEIMKKWLSEKDFDFIKTSKHIPLGILSFQTRAIGRLHSNGELDKFSQIQIIRTTN